MKYDSFSTKIKVLVISILFVGVIIMAFFYDKELAWGLEKIVSCVILSIFSFFFPPMIKYIINWFKALSVEESFYAGYRIGYYGIIGLVLIDPVIGVMYYFNKRLKKNNVDGGNIILVGWYII